MIDLPDIPRWVEAHGIAADPAAWREDLAGGFVVGHDAARLVVIAGEPEPDAVVRVVTAHPTHAALFAIERDDLAVLVRALGRPVERAILHTLPEPDAIPDLEGAVPLDDRAPLPPALADELAWARSRGPVWCAWVDGEPVSFAYAPWRSTSWFDVSVDTLGSARQLGLATIVAAAMIRDECTSGRAPVWGADEGNAASLRLAKRLGFEPVDEIWVAAGA